MKIVNKIASLLLALCLIITTFVVAGIEPCYAAGATSYTNAKEFYQSFEARKQKVDIYNGNFYFATQAGAAASYVTLLFSSIGFDIVMEGNGVSVQFSVEQRREETGNSGSLAEVDGSEVNDGEYVPMRLWKILHKHIMISSKLLLMQMRF